MSTLTDRYVHAVVQQLPADQRDDIARELRGTIEDTVAGRAVGVPVDDAERHALLELGHPARLADSYRGGGRYLIGPRLYPTWVRLLKVLLAIIPAVAGVLVLLIEATSGTGTAGALAAGISAAISAALQVVVWVTAGFALAEYFEGEDQLLDAVGGAGLGEAGEWDPADLPEVQERQVTWGEGIFMVVSNAVLLMLVLLPGGSNFFTLDGERISIFSELALSLRWVLAIGLLVSLVMSILVLVRGRWDPLTAILNTVGNLIFGVPVVWLLLTGELFHIELYDWADGWGDINVLVFALIVIAVLLWDSLDGLIKAWRGSARA